jgi:hypothetical protein
VKEANEKKFVEANRVHLLPRFRKGLPQTTHETKHIIRYGRLKRHLTFLSLRVPVFNRIELIEMLNACPTANNFNFINRATPKQAPITAASKIHPVKSSKEEQQSGI